MNRRSFLRSAALSTILAALPTLAVRPPDTYTGICWAVCSAKPRPDNAPESMDYDIEVHAAYTSECEAEEHKTRIGADLVIAVPVENVPLEEITA